MKKFLLLSLSLLIIFSPILVMAQNGLITCGNDPGDPCDWPDLIVTFREILKFIIFKLALPLGVLAIIIGAVTLMLSAGNPKIASVGKTIIWSAIIGLFLALCTVLIVNFILDTIGSNYKLEDINSSSSSTIKVNT